MLKSHNIEGHGKYLLLGLRLEWRFQRGHRILNRSDITIWDSNIKGATVNLSICYFSFSRPAWIFRSPLQIQRESVTFVQAIYDTKISDTLFSFIKAAIYTWHQNAVENVHHDMVYYYFGVLTMYYFFTDRPTHHRSSTRPLNNKSTWSRLTEKEG